VANLHPAMQAERWMLDAPSWDELQDAELVAELDAMPERADQAERILRRFLRLCEHPVTRKRTLKMVRSIIEGDNTGLRLFRMLNLVTGRRVLKDSENTSAAVVRWQLVAMILAGVALGRYIRDVEPVCSASEDQLVAIVAPSIRAALAR
jgi:hypothetical protein